MLREPILKQQAISRNNPLLTVEHNQIGVLLDGQRFVRLLRPGEAPSNSERMLDGLRLYVVDTTPRALTWQVDLPARSDEDVFSATLNLKYQVADAKRIAREEVADTETLITRVLKPMLREESCRFTPSQSSEAISALENVIKQADLPALSGLRLVDPPQIAVEVLPRLVEQAVLGEFAAVPEVALIYSDRFRAEHLFTLFVQGDEYDDALMDRLLDRELRLIKRFASRPMMFHYLPHVPNGSRHELMRETARLIFEG